ncbi:MAG: single-stranded-DNA-specific exonuclease RecJ [Bdellovibrionaceae bacterium]|nr:single-stranded-DNA-specific exonuclease RecJ [Pseudobdellovibrionaceae bacterium]
MSIGEVIWRPRVAEPKPAPRGIPRLIWEVLSSRGLSTQEEIQKWLSPSLRELRDPFALKDMDKAVERIALAHERGEKICVYCDYDLDGTSACAMLKTAFDWLGLRNISHYQPKRLTEGYGLHKEAIRKIRDEGVSLMITADLGITAIEEVEYAREIGLDIVVTDHHLPKEKLPDAVAVVNPNRGNCESELGHLCGTGVAFYLIMALRRTFLERGWLTQPFDPKLLLDCFVIGTLTDMVPLVRENRVLVKHGLLALAQTRRPGLRALLQALNMWGIPLTSQDVAIRFAPKLNALSRMETGVTPLDLFLAPDESTAETLVAQVLTNNQLRQVSQREAESEAIRQMKEHPPRSVCFVWSPEFHRGVVGLVATRLSQDFGLPAFVGSADESGKIVGSARMPEGLGLSLLDGLEACGDLLVQFGGHAVACGFEVEQKNAPRLAAALEEWFSKQLSEAKASEWVYDAEADLADLNPGFMQWYEQLSPFGAQFEAPVFRLRGVKVAQVYPLKGGHLRLTLGDHPAYALTAIWFSPPKSFLAERSGFGAEAGGGARADVRSDFRSEIKIDVLVEPQWNYFAGRKSLQLLIQDAQHSGN